MYLPGNHEVYSKWGEMVNLVDKIHHFDQFLLIPCLSEDTSAWMNIEKQSDTADMMHLSGQSGVQ